MTRLFAAIRKNYFDNTVELSKLSKTFFLWAIGLVFVYVSNIYLTRLLGLELYGRYTVFISWASLISTLLAFGWDGYLTQKIPLLQKNEFGKITSSHLIVKAVTTFLILYVLFVMLIAGIVHFQKNSFSFLESGQVPVFLILGFLFTLITLLRSFLRIFHIVTKVQWVEDVLKPVILFSIILVYYIYKINLSLSSFYIINLFVFGAVAVFLLVYSSGVYRKNFITGGSTVITEKWVRKCFYFMCIFLGYSIFSRMELLFLGYFSKNEEAAKFQILLRISDMVIIPDFLFNYFLPQKFSYSFANNEISEAKILFRNSSKTVLALQLVCLAGVSLIGYFYLQSFNIASSEMYLFLVVMCTAPVFYSLFGSSNLVLKTSGNERYSFYALLIVLILEAAANYIFIIPYGLKAAVIISWSSILFYTLLLSFFLFRELKFYNNVTRFLFLGTNRSKLS